MFFLFFCLAGTILSPVRTHAVGPGTGADTRGLIFYHHEYICDVLS